MENDNPPTPFRFTEHNPSNRYVMPSHKGGYPLCIFMSIDSNMSLKVTMFLKEMALRRTWGH